MIGQRTTLHEGKQIPESPKNSPVCRTPLGIRLAAARWDREETSDMEESLSTQPPSEGRVGGTQIGKIPAHVGREEGLNTTKGSPSVCSSRASDLHSTDDTRSMESREEEVPLHVLPSVLDASKDVRGEKVRLFISKFNELWRTLRKKQRQFQDNFSDHKSGESRKVLVEMHTAIKEGLYLVLELQATLKFKYEYIKWYRDICIQLGTMNIMIGSYFLSMASEGEDDDYDRAFMTHCNWLMDSECWCLPHKVTLKPAPEVQHDVERNAAGDVMGEIEFLKNINMMNEPGFATTAATRRQGRYDGGQMSMLSNTDYMCMWYARVSNQEKKFQKLWRAVSEWRSFESEMKSQYRNKHPEDHQEKMNRYYSDYIPAFVGKQGKNAATEREDDIDKWKEDIMYHWRERLLSAGWISEEVWMTFCYAKVTGRYEMFHRMLDGQVEWNRLYSEMKENYEKDHSDHFYQMREYVNDLRKAVQSTNQECTYPAPVETEKAMKESARAIISRFHEARMEDGANIRDSWRMMWYAKIIGKSQEYTEIERGMFKAHRLYDEMVNNYRSCHPAHYDQVDDAYNMYVKNGYPKPVQRGARSPSF